MSIELRKLSARDGQDIYEMLSLFPRDENGFVNPVSGKTFEEYKAWLAESEKISQASGLIDGWMVPETVFWLYEDGEPVGFGKVRHFLTDGLRRHGGNIGYGIRPDRRNRGLGKKILGLLVEKKRETGAEEILLTINNDNTPSIRAALANGGKILKTTAERHYITIP